MASPPGDGRRTRAGAAFARTPFGRKLSRYTAGSVLATGIGQGAFFVLFALGVDGSIAAVVGYLAGFVPNYLLNRSWTWGRKDRPSLRGEILPYVAIIVVSAAASAGLTALAERAVATLDVSRAVTVALVTVAFWGITLVLFAAKFLVFDRYLFAASRPRSPSPRPDSGRPESSGSESSGSESSRSEPPKA